MSVIGKSLDLDLKPVRRSVGMRAMAVVDAVTAILQARRNRRAIGSLEAFSDYQLYDIGLTRDDLRASLDDGPFTDPSGYLTQVAREERRPTRRGA